MADLLKLVDELDALTSQEKSALVSRLEESWGIKSSYVSMSEMQPAQPSTPVIEQTEFSVVLTGFTSKVDCIKEVRKVTGLDLKSAKDFVEATAGSPQVVKADLAKADAEAIAGQLRASGSVVEVK